VISVKKFLAKHKHNDNSLDKDPYTNMEIDEILKTKIENFSKVFIKSDTCYVEMRSFYYESVHEFFEHAFSIKVNGELLYSGYRQIGENKYVYIKGKYNDLEQCLNKIKLMFKDVDFQVSNHDLMVKSGMLR